MNLSLYCMHDTGRQKETYEKKMARMNRQLYTYVCDDATKWIQKSINEIIFGFCIRI